MVVVVVVMSNRGRMPNHYFSDTELHLRVSTDDVASTNGTGILCSRAWIRMYVARHLEEHE